MGLLFSPDTLTFTSLHSPGSYFLCLTQSNLNSMAYRSLLCLVILACAHANVWDNAKSTTGDAFSSCKSNKFCAVAAGAVAGVATVAAAPAVVGAVIGVSSVGPVAGGVFATAQAAAATGVAGGGGIAAGSAMAATQGFVMSGATAASLAAGGAVGGVGGAYAADPKCGGFYDCDQSEE